MFGMKEFYISASGATLDHHGPLVLKCNHKERSYGPDKSRPTEAGMHAHTPKSPCDN